MRSSAHDSRWFMSGRCASQQETVQNSSPVRLRLQVDTLQTQYLELKRIGFLHELQRCHWVSDRGLFIDPIVRQKGAR